MPPAAASIRPHGENATSMEIENSRGLEPGHGLAGRRVVHRQPGGHVPAARADGRAAVLLTRPLVPELAVRQVPDPRLLTAATGRPGAARIQPEADDLAGGVHDAGAGRVQLGGGGSDGPVESPAGEPDGGIVGVGREHRRVVRGVGGDEPAAGRPDPGGRGPVGCDDQPAGIADGDPLGGERPDDRLAGRRVGGPHLHRRPARHDQPTAVGVDPTPRQPGAPSASFTLWSSRFSLTSQTCGRSPPVASSDPSGLDATGAAGKSSNRATTSPVSIDQTTPVPSRSEAAARFAVPADGPPGEGLWGRRRRRVGGVSVRASRRLARSQTLGARFRRARRWRAGR